jgi:hypothetical protein
MVSGGISCHPHGLLRGNFNLTYPCLPGVIVLLRKRLRIKKENSYPKSDQIH